MPTIRIPENHWWKVWRALVESGPISRISQDPVYRISERQLSLLKKKKLPFELLPTSNGPGESQTHG